MPVAWDTRRCHPTPPCLKPGSGLPAPPPAQILAQSEGDADDELLSVAVLKNGNKVVCGSTSGVLAIWSWGFWNDCSDRFPGACAAGRCAASLPLPWPPARLLCPVTRSRGPAPLVAGHPESVTSLLRFDEDSVLTGSSDGLIRVLSVQPNKMLGVLGEHSGALRQRSGRLRRARLQADWHIACCARVALALTALGCAPDRRPAAPIAADYPIERLAMSADRSVLASASHDNSVKLWDLAKLGDDDDDDAEDAGAEQAEAQQEEAAAADGKRQGAAAAADSSTDDSDSDAGGGRRGKRNKRKKGQHKIMSKKQAKRSGNNFFAGLL